MTHNWLTTRKKGHSNICVKCPFRSASAVRSADLKRHFPFLCIFFFFEHVYFSTKFNVVVNCRLGSACAECTGWSENDNLRKIFGCPFSRVASHIKHMKRPVYADVSSHYIRMQTLEAFFFSFGFCFKPQKNVNPNLAWNTWPPTDLDDFFDAIFSSPDHKVLKGSF